MPVFLLGHSSNMNVRIELNTKNYLSAPGFLWWQRKKGNNANRPICNPLSFEVDIRSKIPSFTTIVH